MINIPNNPINSNSGINNLNIPSNIGANKDDKKISKDSAEVIPYTDKKTQYQPKDFEKLDIDKVDELKELKDPSEEEN